MKWIVKATGGRYVRCHEPGTLCFSFSRHVAQVFEGTRDYVDGICKGLEMSTGDKYVPEQFIHYQKPAELQKL